MTVDMWEHAARMFEPVTPKWATPGELAVSIDPRTRQTPALDLIDAELVRAFNTPDARLVISMPPQEGKSQRASRRFPLWCLTQNPDLRIAIASYEMNTARRWGRTIRDDIAQNTEEIGLRVREDLSAQGEWQLAGHEGGVYSAGVGGALTGRPVDLLIIDDPVKGREQADSPTIREKTWDWWTDSASTRLAPGAPVILILTRWHNDDLAGRLLAAEDGKRWRVVNIPAQADHRPERGETDPLGREPGEFMLSARDTEKAKRNWPRIKVQAGPRTWASLYQGRPTPGEGGIFPAEWRRYTERLHIDRPDGTCWVPGVGRDDHELVQSWDFTFKDTKASDYVVGQVWLRIGVTAYLLDMVRARMNFNDSCNAMLALTAKWPQALAKFVEDKANGPAVMNSLAQRVPGMIPIEPEGSKTARANAISPFAHAGNIVLPDPSILPNVEELVEEAKSFPAGAHDDTIDAMSQATNRLLLMPLTDGLHDQIEPDAYEEADLRGYAITPY